LAEYSAWQIFCQADIAERRVTPTARTYLTDRELEVLALLGKGMTTKEIAGRLELSIWTVKSHLANARRRTNARTNVQLALIGRRITRSS
jgi:DNA-binding CsgD family transcriptional regulator